MITSMAFASLALSLAISPTLFATAFSHAPSKICRTFSTQLKYRSLHHGPDVEPLSDSERQGADATKMEKDRIHRYGPGDFAQYVDPPSSHLFDGGDSEMGLSGDGDVGLYKIGRDTSPHMARTLMAKMDQATAASEGYAEELLANNPGMDAVRAQQLENWATQNEIAMENKYTYERFQHGQSNHISEIEHGDVYERDALLTYPIQAGSDVEGLVLLRTHVGGATAHELEVKNPYMGYAGFRAAFIGDASNEWSVTPSQDFLEQNKATKFVVRYSPCNPGVSHAYLVIETEDFKKTWKVVGSTGEYEF